MEGEMMSQSASSDRNKRSFVEAFTNLSTCTVCLEAFDEKVMQCQNGHLICGNCHATVSNSTSRCPSCNIALGNIRSLITEQLVQQQMKPCRFGCSDREMEYDERKQHERECNARPFCCPIAQCNEQITPASAVSHMKEMHKHEMILGKQTVCVNDTGITSGSWVTLTKVRGNPCVVVFELMDEITGLLPGNTRCYLMSLGMNEGWSYTVSMSGKGRKLTFTGPARHARDQSSITAGHDCLVVPRSMALYLGGGEEDLKAFRLTISWDEA